MKFRYDVEICFKKKKNYNGEDYNLITQQDPCLQT